MMRTEIFPSLPSDVSNFISTTWRAIDNHEKATLAWEKKIFNIKAAVIITGLGILLIGYSNPFGLTFTATYLSTMRFTESIVYVASLLLMMDLLRPFLNFLIPILIPIKEDKEDKDPEGQKQAFLGIMYTLNFEDLYRNEFGRGAYDAYLKNKNFSDWCTKMGRGELMIYEMFLDLSDILTTVEYYKNEEERISKLPPDSIHREERVTGLKQTQTHVEEACAAFRKKFKEYHENKTYRVVPLPF
jgi:hypothetical protein